MAPRGMELVRLSLYSPGQNIKVIRGAVYSDLALNRHLLFYTLCIIDLHYKGFFGAAYKVP